MRPEILVNRRIGVDQFPCDLEPYRPLASTDEKSECLR